MNTVAGTILDEGGAVYNVKSPQFGAYGDGIHDDQPAIQAALTRVRDTGGIVFLPWGTYLLGSPLHVTPVAGSYGSITLQGEGIGNAARVGTTLLYSGTGNTGSALVLGPSSNDTGLYNFTLRDLTVQAHSAAFTGNLVQATVLGICRFENCGFVGAVSATAPTRANVSALVRGNFWIDVHFIRCQFSNAGTGVRQDQIGGITNAVNDCSFQQCRFAGCSTSVDLGSTANVWVMNSTFEPALDNSASTLVLKGNPTGGVTGCWLGDGNHTGTWIRVGGLCPNVLGNAIYTGEVGVELLPGTYGARVEGNHVYDAGRLAISCLASASSRIAQNFIYLHDGTTAVQVTADATAAVTGNVVANIHGTGRGTTGLQLESGTGGEESLNVVSADTPISHSAHSTWNVPTFNGATVAGPLLFTAGGRTQLQLNGAGAGAHDTAAYLAWFDGRTWTAPVRVSVGGIDSGGIGYRSLRIPN